MVQWSDLEISRTVEEIKRRSLIDPEFRALALSNANAAIAKVNPKPIPPGFTVRFVDSAATPPISNRQSSTTTVVLPEPLARVVELSDAELDQVQGGDGGLSPKLRTS